MTLHVKNLIIEAENTTVKTEKDILLNATGNIIMKAAGKISAEASGSFTAKGASATIDAPSTSVTGSMTVAQDATASGISVAHHTHTTPHGESGAPQ